MNLLKLLIPKEKIVGIDISSQKLRMFYLEQDAYGNITIKGKSETDIDNGTIISGEVKEKKKLLNAFDKLKQTFAPIKLLSNFAVVTIPPDKIYSEIMEFPKILDSQQLLEAISTNAADKLPFSISSCYFDWEIIDENNGKNQVLVSLAKKDVIDPYIEILRNAGFELIALETYFFSLERIIDLPESPVILIYFTDDGISCTIYKKKRPYFSQFETWDETSYGKKMKNIGDLKNVIRGKLDMLSLYFESRNNSQAIERAFIISREFNSDALIKKIGKMRFPIEKATFKISSLENSDWLPASGAAARAFIPRSDDTVTSLLPIGTESLYETQKAISFSKSILFFTSSLSLFYIAIFSAFFFFISSLETSLSSQLSMKSSIPISAEYEKMETDTRALNNYISDIISTQSSGTNDYAPILEKINKLAYAGTSFLSISMNEAGIINISGKSASRESYRYFKSAITSSPDFSNVVVSSPDIAKKNDINFTVSMRLK